MKDERIDAAVSGRIAVNTQSPGESAVYHLLCWTTNDTLKTLCGSAVTRSEALRAFGVENAPIESHRLCRFCHHKKWSLYPDTVTPEGLPMDRTRTYTNLPEWVVDLVESDRGESDA